MIKTLFSQKLTDISSTDKDGVGRLRYEDDGKIYRYVQNASTTQTLSAGQATCHTLTEGASMTQKVNQPATANLAAFAGIAMTNIPPSYYGYVQCYGENSITLVRIRETTTKTAGSASYPINGQISVDGVSGDPTAVGTAPVYRRFVQTLTIVSTATPSTNTIVPVFIYAL